MQSGAISRSALFDCLYHTNQIWIVKEFLARRDLYLAMHGTYIPVVSVTKRQKSANKAQFYLHFLKRNIIAQKPSGIAYEYDV